MKALIEKIICLRNPLFKFDEGVNSLVLIQFICQTFWGILRGYKLLLFFRWPYFAMLGKGVRITNLPRIRFGKYLKLGKHVSLSALGKKGISLGNNVSIGDFSKIVVSTTFNQIGSHIRIGHNVGMGEFAYLGGAGGLEIGDDCIIGQYFSCHPENHNYANTDELIRNQGVSRKGIKIGSNCWIGSKVTILDGVTIGNGCVIAAGAVVTGSFPDNCIIGGVPARLLKARKN